MTRRELNIIITRQTRKKAFTKLRIYLKNAAAAAQVLRTNSMRAPQSKLINRWARTNQTYLDTLATSSREFEDEDLDSQETKK